LTSGAFFLTNIQHWLPRPWSLNSTEEGRAYVLPAKPLLFFRFCSLVLDAEVICEVFALRMGRIKSVPQIRIIPRVPKSLDWFFFVGSRLENFFALFLGTSVSLKSVAVSQGNDSGWLVRKMQKRKQEIRHSIWVRCQGHEMAAALAVWLATPEEKRPVEKTVLGMLRRSALFVETEFLALAQALEGFGRLHFESNLIPKQEFKKGLSQVKDMLVKIWATAEIAKRCSDALATANEPSYSRRIEQAYSLLSADFALKLLGERSQFVRTVVQTRNYFTHLGIKKGKAVVDDVEGLFLLNRRLHAFLRCIMLLDLGIPEELLQKPILHQISGWW
jgi:hypothetical protein